MPTLANAERRSSRVNLPLSADVAMSTHTHIYTYERGDDSNVKADGLACSESLHGAGGSVPCYIIHSQFPSPKRYALRNKATLHRGSAKMLNCQ